MRYIGSKILLLDRIEQVIDENVDDGSNSFCDIFSGTASVARFFKKRFKIISNDIMHFSYVLQMGTISNNLLPTFEGLKKIKIDEPFEFLNNSNIVKKNLLAKPFIFENFSPNKKTDRMYLSNDNALRIDFVRQTIESWKNDKLINEAEYYYLLASLIEAVPFVSNIAGTYGAYLKIWDNRSQKKIKIEKIEIINNKKKNQCFNLDSGELIKNIKGDILYIDPPYNSRQYLPNYHLLETISKYDSPEIKGKTGIRPYEKTKSKYCIKSKVLEEFSYLIKNANFRHIIVSYSSEGLMSEKEIEKVLKDNGVISTYRLYRIPYRRYKRVKGPVNHKLEEFLFYIKKL